MPCGKRSKVEDVSPILDIQKIMQDWAWKDYLKDADLWERLTVRRSDVDVDVPMNFYQFEDSTAKLEDVQKDKHEGSSESKNLLPNMNIMTTDYENNTSLKQVYKFRMERARTASVNVTYQKGFSIGGKANFSIAGVGGEFESRLEITKTNGQSFEETLTFETTSDIEVENKHHCTAQVVFTQKEIRKKFSVRTTMSMPSGSAPISIRRKKDQKLYASFTIHQLQPIFQKYIDKGLAETVELGEIDGFETSGIVFTTTGIIEGITLSGQSVRLDSTAITDSKTKTLSQVTADHKLRELEMTQKM